MDRLLSLLPITDIWASEDGEISLWFENGQVIYLGNSRDEPITKEFVMNYMNAAPEVQELIEAIDDVGDLDGILFARDKLVRKLNYAG